MGGFGDWIANTFAKSTSDIVTALGDQADRFIQTKEEKAAFQLEIMKAEQAIQRLNMEGEKMYFADRQSAREMYMKDSSLQKIFALVFLIGYIGLSTAMVLIVFGFLFKTGPGMELDAFQASIISMVFTAMSTKVNTITDFLFGGSKGKDDSEKRLAEQFEIKATQN